MKAEDLYPTCEESLEAITDTKHEPTVEERAAAELVSQFCEAYDIEIDDCEHMAGEIARVLFFFDPVVRAAIEAERERWEPDVAEVRRLREELAVRPMGKGTTHWTECWKTYRHHDCALHEIARLREALGRIEDWANAYPTDIFIEPSKVEWKEIAEVLKRSGFTLDAISGSNFRHCLKGVGKIARAALGGK